MQHDDWVYSASISPDGLRIVTTSRDKTARLWDAGTGHPIGKPIRHDEAVASASYSPDGRLVVTASGSVARVWDDAGVPVGPPMPDTNDTYER